MKNLLINTRIAVIALALTFTLAFASQAQANDEKNPSGIEFKFIGNYQQQPVFQLTYNNSVENEFNVVVRDQHNNVLYRETLKGTSIAKKFILNTEEIGDGDVTFEITGKKGSKAIVYEVSNNSRLIQDVVVNKVK